MGKLAVCLVVLGLAWAFTIETAKGDGTATKILKFLGLVGSIAPIVGVALFFVLRRTHRRYADRCGLMLVAGLLLTVVIFFNALRSLH
jgi:hypothetical protein